MGATWWEITFTGDPTDDDLEHVAEQIKAGFTSGQLTSGHTRMTEQEAVDWFKARYQIDPARGYAWMETSDIEEAVFLAADTGRAHLAGQVITWDEDTGYTITADTQP